MDEPTTTDVKLEDAFEFDSFHLHPENHAGERYMEEEHHKVRCLRPDCGWTNVILEFEGGRKELERTAANHLAWHEDLDKLTATPGGRNG